MATARIYRPAKTAMQSGRAKACEWLLEFEPGSPRECDRLMGWTSSRDMPSDEVRLRFPTEADAVAFAEKHGLTYQLMPPRERTIRPKAYADNFRTDRPQGNWTH
ncbi:MAG: ETC complex I subunit [Alphaproteobacteria bacterium]|nr:ETC complex I subunit [Alphaproteobacteria bacterium]